MQKTLADTLTQPPVLRVLAGKQLDMPDEAIRELSRTILDKQRYAFQSRIDDLVLFACQICQNAVHEEFLDLKSQ